MERDKAGPGRRVEEGEKSILHGPPRVVSSVYDDAILEASMSVCVIDARGVTRGKVLIDCV